MCQTLEQVCTFLVVKAEPYLKAVDVLPKRVYASFGPSPHGNPLFGTSSWIHIHTRPERCAPLIVFPYSQE